MTEISGWEWVLVAGAAVLAGAINALAGGGTLVTFPVLTALGLPAITANVTNTIALCPGYIGGILAQAADLRGQARRVGLLLPVSAVGGIAGGLLLLNTGERLFQELVPFLILLASLLLAAQSSLRAWLTRRARPTASGTGLSLAAVLAVGLATVYGGYFGAGLSVIVLAVLGLALDDSLTRLSALKQVVSFGANTAAAGLFAVSGEPMWPVVAVMAGGALLGGALGGRLARRVPPELLRWIVVVTGLVVALIYFIR